jgi:hypothetical protein
MSQALVEQPAVVIREVCRTAWREAGWPEQSMGYDQWHLLASQVADKRSTSKLNLPGNVQAWREGQSVVVKRHGTP